MIFVWLQDLDWYCDYCPPKGTSVVSDLHIRPGVGGHILLCVDVISAVHLCLHALTSKGRLIEKNLGLILVSNPRSLGLLSISILSSLGLGWCRLDYNTNHVLHIVNDIENLRYDLKRLDLLGSE